MPTQVIKQNMFTAGEVDPVVYKLMAGAAVDRLVAWREELEGEFKMRLGFAAVGMNVARAER